MTKRTGVELPLWPSGAGLTANAMTPGTSPISGRSALTISCWLRSRWSHGTSLMKEMPCDGTRKPATTK